MPVINLEWIQKLQRDKSLRGYSTEAVTDTILRRMHDYVRFDGKEWKWYGHDRNSKEVRSGEQPALYEDRLAIMLPMPGSRWCAQLPLIRCRRFLPSRSIATAADCRSPR